MDRRITRVVAGVLLGLAGIPGLVLAQVVTPGPPVAAASGEAAAAPTAVTPPADYVIGPGDVLTIVFWREQELSTDVVVRPDGKISLALVNDIAAAGLTPEQLRVNVTNAAARLYENPTVHVIVKEIHSRNVFITGEVARPGPYPLTGPTTVLQLIAMAGGVAEYADKKNISILRVENGRPMSFRFNYSDVSKRKNLQQNILLMPGDTIVVP